MFISFYKKSYLPQLLSLVFITAILWFPQTLLILHDRFHISEIFSMKYPLISQITGFLFFISSAFIVNQSSVNGKLINKNSLLTAFFFILMGASTKFFTCWSYSLPAVFFFALLFQNIFRFQNNHKIIRTAFDAGLLLGVTGLFFGPSIILLIFIWIALIIYQIDQWRAYIVSLIGVLLPWAFFLIIYFWDHETKNFFLTMSNFFQIREIVSPFHSSREFYLFLFIVFLIFISVIWTIQKLSSYNVSLRQHSLVTLWGLFFTSFLLLFFNVPLSAGLLAIVPAAILLGMLFSSISPGSKNMKRAEWLIFLWLIFIFINQYSALFNVIFPFFK